MADKKTSQGYADVVVGLQYGDEGKARVVDKIAPQYDVIARFNGGSNAGHTVVVEGKGKVALQQVPSGVFHENSLLYIGSGCVVNIEKLAGELDRLSQLGIDLKERLKISPQATVIQPHHMVLDALWGGTIGTTKNGIGPAYADRAARMRRDQILNIKMGDLVADPEHFFSCIQQNLDSVREAFSVEQLQEAEDMLHLMKKALPNITPVVVDDPLFLTKRIEAGAKILFEGAQSTMLDVVKGSVPYVTSSHTTASAAFVGGDVPARYVRRVIGVAKAVMSRVGHGPFPSEFGGAQSEAYCMKANPDGGPTYGKATEKDYNVKELIGSGDQFEMGKAMRILSGEYGTVTTRPRRVGALDLVQMEYAIRVSGVTEMVLTKCDLLREYADTKKGKIPLVSSYELNGKTITYLPSSTREYYKVTPQLEYQPGFDKSVTEARKKSDVSAELMAHLDFIAQCVGCPISGIGVGPERDQFVEL